jgi:hypothetical protein
MHPPELLTERLFTFVQEAVAMLAKDPYPGEIPKVERPIWRQGQDGYFGFTIALEPDWGLALRGKNQDCLDSLSYEQVLPALLEHPETGYQITKRGAARKLVGVEHNTSPIYVERIAYALLGTAVTSEGRFAPDLDKFRELWSQIWESLSAEKVRYKLLAPLHDFYAELPIRLSPDLEIAKFADDEVKQCSMYGLIPRTPYGESGGAVGIRFHGHTSKVCFEENLAPAAQTKPRIDPGAFGSRSVATAHRLVEDVLAVLRLLKPGYAWSPGSILSFGNWFLYPVTQFRAGRPFQQMQYALSEQESCELEGLWKTLSERVLKQHRFMEVGLRRFSSAFDRFEPEDRIVDLFTSAESLFLQGDKELSFQLALRASKFIKHPMYTEREVFRVMRDGYNKLRSAIVHGSDTSDVKTRPLLKKSQPPSIEEESQPPSIEEFTDVVQEIMRLGLRQAVDRLGDGKRFGTAENDENRTEWWEALLFGECPDRAVDNMEKARMEKARRAQRSSRHPRTKPSP